MDAQVRRALERDRVIDITTTGRKTGQQRRIEIWFDNVDGKLFLSGLPGRRGWYANLVAEPNFTFHLKHSVIADLPAKATPIRDPNQKREIFSEILKKRGAEGDLEAWLQGSPLVEVELQGL